MKLKISIFHLTLTVFLLISLSASAKIELPRLIDDDMVLQRNVPVKIWGWASVHEKIIINFRNNTYHTTANKDGEWELMLPSMEAGGPYTMKIKGSNSLILNDIMIGEVWVSSGQSNMELPVYRVKPLYEDQIIHSNNSHIRYFDVPDDYNFHQPQKRIDSGNWRKANPETVLNFSAAAYFFAKKLNERYNIPVGIINSSLGGSPAESWISEDVLKRKYPGYYRKAQKFKNSELVQKIRRIDRQRRFSAG
jgi:sialate O-acetylesterase